MSDARKIKLKDWLLLVIGKQYLLLLRSGAGRMTCGMLLKD
jgi:hypothetical protein